MTVNCKYYPILTLIQYENRSKLLFYLIFLLECTTTFYSPLLKMSALGTHSAADVANARHGALQS